MFDGARFCPSNCRTVPGRPLCRAPDEYLVILNQLLVIGLYHEIDHIYKGCCYIAAHAYNIYSRPDHIFFSLNSHKRLYISIHWLCIFVNGHKISDNTDWLLGIDWKSAQIAALMALTGASRPLQRSTRRAQSIGAPSQCHSGLPA